jgi:hypothetical protein
MAETSPAHPEMHSPSSHTASLNCFVPRIALSTCAATSHRGILDPFKSPCSEARSVPVRLYGNGLESVLWRVSIPAPERWQDEPSLRDQKPEDTECREYRELVLDAQAVDQRTVRVIRVFGRREVVIQSDRRGIRNEHLVDRHQDGLDSIRPLELPKEVDV